VAKRRKVSNLMALAVLGTLVQRPMHPYEIASVLRARAKDEDMPIKWGSLYTVVRNLEKHGFVEAVGSSRDGARPERTTYRLTPAGGGELRDWVRELLGTPEPERTRFRAALSMLGAIGPDEAVELLRQRVELLRRRVTAERDRLAGLDVPRLFLVEDEYEIAVQEAELAWTRGLLAELESGTFPDVAAWRAFHTSGEIPPEYRELSERGSPEP
jgi:DNA-binding PadR family transcriptional regulator